jgi:hypothetical protein
MGLPFFSISDILIKESPCGYSSVVEHLLAMENVARSTRVTRFVLLSRTRIFRGKRLYFSIENVRFRDLYFRNDDNSFSVLWPMGDYGAGRRHFWHVPQSYYLHKVVTIELCHIQLKFIVLVSDVHNVYVRAQQTFSKWYHGMVVKRVKSRPLHVPKIALGVNDVRLHARLTFYRFASI